MRLSLALKALRALGPRQVGLYALYQLGLGTGHYHRVTQAGRQARESEQDWGAYRSVLALPEREELEGILGVDGRLRLMAEADEILGGRVRLFGGEAIPLNLAPPGLLAPPGPLAPSSEIPPGNLAHWTKCAREKFIGGAPHGDVKFVWEPARFGWAFTLGRAYHLSKQESYAQAFWKYAESFLEANPPYQGLNWVSGQEVALRIMAFVFALQAFDSSPTTTPERSGKLTRSIAAHAMRILPSLVYARAQNNNHLLSEAAGLYTAGACLPGHPAAQRWRESGWRWFHSGLESQIAQDGAYVQHSANYHRLMLQLGLWMFVVAGSRGESFPERSMHKLARATRWLLELLDPHSGCVPNLGPNDGAYILPLTVRPFQDYRPVLQAASAIFLGERILPRGDWDEMGWWLGSGKRIGSGLVDEDGGQRMGSGLADGTGRQWKVGQEKSMTPHVLRAGSGQPGALPDSWGYVRAARFTDRPGHADQLHLDLWWRGLNVAQDAGTYLYNAGPPWDNALKRTAVHNTVTVNALEQMTSAGKFLYLDWAQAQALSWDRNGEREKLVARHDGYRRLGVIHQRSVSAFTEGKWVIEDSLLPRSAHAVGSVSIRASLHWLLPDFSYQLQIFDSRFLTQLETPRGLIVLEISVGTAADQGREPAPLEWLVARAGERLHGSGEVSPTWGWSSPTYGVKIPALSVRLTQTGALPLFFNTTWTFPPVD